MTTCLVGYSSIEATPPAAGTTTSRKAARTTPCRRLRIDPSHHTTPVIKTTGHAGLVLTTDINHRMASWQDQQMGTYLHLPRLHHILRYTPFVGNQPLHCHSCTIQYFRWLLPIPMRSDLGNHQTTLVCQYHHGSIALRIQFCIHCFLQYTPNY